MDNKFPIKSGKYLLHKINNIYKILQAPIEIALFRINQTSELNRDFLIQLLKVLYDV